MSTFVLKPLNQHSFDLSIFFSRIDIPGLNLKSKLQIADWLNIAAGVCDVGFDFSQLENSEKIFEDLYKPIYREKCQNLSSLIKDLVILDFTWNALEKLINDYFPMQDQKRYGPITTLCKYLRSTYDPTKNLILYNQQIRELKFQFKKGKESFPRVDQNTGKSGIGVSIVAQIQRSIISGMHIFPLAISGLNENHVSPKIIQLSTRIILLTIQMFSLTLFKDSQQKMKCWWLGDGLNKSVFIHAFLRMIHLNI